ncbi:MAG: S8 family serine peptidase [Phycisphaeraceae bacterium]|nr:MAG: S8 family serine peptidase [Phycisphaeraceae bacterium]
MNTRKAVSVCLLAGLAVSASAEVVAVPVAGRIAVFDLDAPGAVSSSAVRLDARPSAIRNGHIAALEGHGPRAFNGAWTLTDRVLIRATDAAAVARAIAGDGGSLEPVPGVHSWFAVRTGRVDTAIALASRLRGDPAISLAELDAAAPITTRDLPTDNYFNLQWHLYDTIFPGVDAHVVPVWNAGITGEGVTICIVESNGFQLDHPDLVANVNTDISPATTFPSSHMTSVAGIAAAARNGMGVVGTAYGAQLSQALIGASFQTAAALGLHNEINDVKNNSWGPIDDGNIDPPSPLVMDAIATGVAEGRGGLGEVYVWAGGNGAGAHDRVDYDPYASSRYTIAVGAIGDDEIQSDYSEPGSSLLVCAYSNGGSLGITSTNLNGGYTFSFGGTSAASPLTAGVVALMLQANPSLTWRDVQHILVDTARMVDPGDERWTPNGDGRMVNEAYGFGVVDASAAVALAQGWSTVAPETSLSTGVIPVNEAIPDGSADGVDRTVFVNDNVRLESVELIMNATTLYVGDLEITLTSPDGTASPLAVQRLNDSGDDLINTVFTSTRHWGELSGGTWTVHVADRRAGIEATWQDFELRFHGVAQGPGPCGPIDFAEPFGVLDLADLSGFVVAFLTGDPSADFAEPFGELTGEDITEFVAQFNQGCP